MEIKTVIKRIGTIALLMVLCFILQTGVFSRLHAGGGNAESHVDSDSVLRFYERTARRAWR